jgi:hypothetical protein
LIRCSARDKIAGMKPIDAAPPNLDPVTQSPPRHDKAPLTAAERAARYRARKRKTINKRRRALHKIRTNKFNGGAKDGKHYWLTPPALYAGLDAEFRFDFDPCPYPRPEGFDGLTCQWGESSYVNPPFGTTDQRGRKAGPTAWARKAITEHRKGRRVVLVFPLDRWVLMLLEAGARIRNLGDVRWLAIEDQSEGRSNSRHLAAFILEPEHQSHHVPYQQQLRLDAQVLEC